MVFGLIWTPTERVSLGRSSMHVPLEETPWQTKGLGIPMEEVDNIPQVETEEISVGSVTPATQSIISG